MRYLKLMTVVAMLLAVSGMAGAVGIPFTHPWGTGGNTAVFAHLTNYDAVTTYTGKFVTGANAPQGVSLLPEGGLGSDGKMYPALQANLPNGADLGESAWGVFQIDTIFEGRVPNPFQHNNITIQNAKDPLFSAGFQGKELVGIFHGRTDSAVTFFSDGTQKIEAIADVFEVYLQDVGTFDEGTAGSAGRIAPNKYVSAGFDAGGNQIGELVLNGSGAFGFVGSPFVPGAQDVLRFDPKTDVSGAAETFIQLFKAGEVSQVGTANAQFDNDYFIGITNAGARADLRLKSTTTLNNGSNLAPEAIGAFDWTVTTSDPLTGNDIVVIPEPTTMLGMFLAVGGLTRYIRRRRA